MTSGLRDLRIWQDSVALGGDVVRLVRPHVRRESRVVTDTLMQTALAVAAHVADGYARYTPAEQRESYMLARRALLRLETELAIARHADLLPAAVLADLPGRIAQLARMLTGFLVYLDRQLADREGASPGTRPTAATVSPGCARDPS
jgi:four helix bundle protein